MIIYISVLFIKYLYNWVAACFFSHGAPIINQTTAVVIQVYYFFANLNTCLLSRKLMLCTGLGKRYTLNF
jgi:hypothetical protein